MVRTAERWRDELADPSAIVYLADDGYVAYGLADEVLTVTDLVAGSAETAAALWSVVGSGSSAAPTVRVHLEPRDPVRLVLGELPERSVDEIPWMLRVIDLPAAIAGRGFSPHVTASADLVVDRRTGPRQHRPLDSWPSRPGPGSATPASSGGLARRRGRAARPGRPLVRLDDVAPAPRRPRHRRLRRRRRRPRRDLRRHPRHHRVLLTPTTLPRDRCIERAQRADYIDQGRVGESGIGGGPTRALTAYQGRRRRARPPATPRKRARAEPSAPSAGVRRGGLADRRQGEQGDEGHRADDEQRVQDPDVVAEEAEQRRSGEEGGVADRRHDAHPRRGPRRLVGGRAHPDREAEAGPEPPDRRADEGEDRSRRRRRARSRRTAATKRTRSTGRRPRASSTFVP